MKKKKWNKSRRAFLAFLLPSFLGVMFFVLLPFLDVFKRSFTTAVTGEFVGLKNYETVYENGAFRLAVGNTLRFTLVCLPLLLFLGLCAALLLTNLKQVQLIKSFFLLPMAMPAATVVLIWKMTFSGNGLLNRMLSSNTDYMGTELAFWVLVFSYVWKNLGYTVVLWLAGLLAIPEDYIQAAKVDGAGRVRIFFSIILPQLKGSMYTITVLIFLNSFKVFRESYLVSGSYPHESMYLLQHMFNNWFVYLELDKMADAAVSIGVVLLAVILLLEKLWEEGDGES
ncbi:MAG: carbohydrate ABC transporter permease [Eisenbergiella sp.]